MTPYEILLSESQERMLIIAKHGRENIVRRIFDKWDVPWAEIGRVTDDGMMRVSTTARLSPKFRRNRWPTKLHFIRAKRAAAAERSKILGRFISGDS